jgi:hypothetical protein
MDIQFNVTRLNAGSMVNESKEKIIWASVMTIDKKIGDTIEGESLDIGQKEAKINIAQDKSDPLKLAHEIANHMRLKLKEKQQKNDKSIGIVVNFEVDSIVKKGGVSLEITGLIK